MAFIGEVLSRAGRPVERHRFAMFAVRVGRGYDNDLILSDPYVAPFHLRIKPTAGGFTVERQDPGAHTAVARRDLETESAEVASGTEIVVGTTHLRVLDERHEVAPALDFEPLEEWFVANTRPARIALFTLGYVLIDLANRLSVTTVEFELLKFAQPLLSMLLVMLGWTAFVALLTRISRGETRFLHHWLAAMLAALTSIVLDRIVDLIAFNTLSVPVVAVVENLALGISLAVLFTLNLRFAFRYRPVVRHAAAQTAAWLVVGYGLLTSYSFLTQFRGQPEFVSVLLPDTVLVRPTVTEGEFLAAADGLFEAAAAKRDDDEEDEG